MECLLCKRKGGKTFNINFLCGDAQYTVKDDLTEFLGNGIEPHLKHEDVVCNICMNMLDDIAKIKRKLLDIILTPRESIYPIKLGKSWDFFAKSAKVARNQFEESDFDELITPSSLTPLSVTPNPNRSTPSQFWSFSHSKEYNPELKENCARREMAKRRRSQSKASIRSSSSYGNDEEVAKLFKGRKRKGRRPQSAGGLPKILTKKLRRVQSENDRSISPLSNMSCVSYSRPKKDFRPKTPKLIYGEDKELIRPRTRSVSRMVFYCTDCVEDEKDMEMYTAHMIVVHNRKACYTCLECRINYMTEEHLAMHQKTHSSVTMCTICGEKLNDIVALRKHTDQHFIYSVPCSYCDLSFLSEYECRLHFFNHHKGKKRKLRDQTQYKIEEVVTYVDIEGDKTTNAKPRDSNYSTKEYSVIPMILNIEKRPKFREPTFDQLDFRVRHSELIEKPKVRTSLGDDLVQDSRLLNSRSSDSPSSIFSDSDADVTVSDSSTSVLVSQRKKIKSPRQQERSVNKDKNLPQRESPNSKLDSLYVDLKTSDFSNLDERISPPQNNAPEVRNEMTMTFDEESDNSDIQTEMHYLDGKTLYTNVELADIVNINSSSGSGESNPPGEGVALDPDIGHG